MTASDEAGHGPVGQGPVSLDQMGRGHLGHRPGLDALRGIAVVSIVAYHADPGWFPLAPMSLDAFFVLSTFLVTTLLLDSVANRGAPQGRRFFTRRARRLAAGLAAMLVAVLLLAAAGHYGSPEVGSTALGAALLHANVAQFGGDYFSAFADRNPLEHTWSLSVEEHFYLATFASVAVFWVLSRRNLRRLRVSLLVLAAVVAVGSVLMSRHLLASGATANRIYMGTDTRAVAAAAGVALAVGLWGRWDLPPRPGRLLSAAAWALGAGVLVALVVGWTPTLDWYANGGWALTALAAAVIVTASARSRDTGRVSGHPALQWAGSRSYGIYLWHLPLLVLLADMGGPGVALALGATMLAAELSHRLVERRFRLNWPADARFVPMTVGAFAAIAAFAIMLPTADLPQWAAPSAARSEAPPPTDAPAPAATPEAGAAASGAVAEPGAAVGGATEQAPVALVVFGDATAQLVGSRLGEDPRFDVEIQARAGCTTAASCAGITPLVSEDATALVLAMADVERFHPPIGNPWDLEAPERTAGELWLQLTRAAAGRPIVLAMAPEARRDLGVGLHVRRMAADDPANLVLDAEPDGWADAVAARFAQTSAPTKVLVVGDSVAYSLATAFAPDDSVVWDQSRHGCDPSPGQRVMMRGGRDRTPTVCDWRTDWTRAVESWDPDVVLWHTGTWSTYDREVDGNHLAAGSAEWHDAVAAAHSEALGILGSQGARVVLAVTAPAWETASDKPLETRPEESARRMPLLVEAARDAAAGTESAAGREFVTVLDTSEFLCDPSCERPDLRDDGVHYTPQGARAVSDWLVQAGGF